MTAERFEHSGAAAETTLVGDITATSTALTILNGTGWPTGAVGKFWIVIDPDTSKEEHLLVNARTGTALTLVSADDRGLDGTAAQAHSSGAKVRHILSAVEADRYLWGGNDPAPTYTAAPTAPSSPALNDLWGNTTGDTSVGGGTPGPTGPQGPVAWKAPVTWSAATYSPAAPADVVIYGGIVWVAIATSTNVTPGSDATKWTPISITGDLLPWRVIVDTLMSPAATAGNASVLTQDSACVYGGRRGNSSGAAQNDSIDFQVVLGAGTWTIEVLHTQSNDRGIYTVQLDDGAGIFTNVGSAPFNGSASTFDAYNAAATRNVVDTITGITISQSVKRVLRFLMAGKNASSSNYRYSLQQVMFRRTA